MLRRILLVISFLSISTINTSHQTVTIQNVKCLGDVNNDLIVDDRDLEIIKSNYDYENNSIYDIVPMLYSYGDDCQVKIYLPVVYK